MNRLKELRKNNHLLQKDIAKKINISQTRYSKYEVETRDIPTNVLKDLARYYGTSIDYLLYMTDDKSPYQKSFIEENTYNI